MLDKAKNVFAMLSLDQLDIHMQNNTKKIVKGRKGYVVIANMVNAREIW